MANCSLVKQLVITTEDKPGMLAEVTSVLSGVGVNITSICAYGMQGKAILMLLSNNNQKAKSSIKDKNWNVQEVDVVVVDLIDKVGSLKEIADKLKSKNINLEYCYGTTCNCGVNCTCRLVLKSKDSNEIIKALK